MKRKPILLACSIGLAACAQSSDAVPPRETCDAASMRWLASDTWPVAGTVRRDEFTTSECATAVLTRTAVAAPRGFKAGELYVVTQAAIGTGSRFTSAEFVGQADGVSYRYQFKTKPGGADVAAAGSVERPPISSIGLMLAPGVRQSDGVSRTISCSSAAIRCELMVQRVSGDVVTALFIVRIDEKAPGGEVCVDSPGPGSGAAQPAVEFTADGKRLVSAQAKPETAQVCLGPKSGRALDLIAAARRLDFNVIRAPGDRKMPWDHTEIDAKGMREAIALTEFLFGKSVASDERVRAEAAFAREAAKLR